MGKGQMKRGPGARSDMGTTGADAGIGVDPRVRRGGVRESGTIRAVEGAHPRHPEVDDRPHQLRCQYDSRKSHTSRHSRRKRIESGHQSIESRIVFLCSKINNSMQIPECFSNRPPDRPGEAKYQLSPLDNNHLKRRRRSFLSRTRIIYHG